MTADEIRYTLSRQVPAMEVEVILQTHYGDVHLCGLEAAMVASVVKHLLEDKLERLERSS